ncbi:hypothetical protein AYI68_g3653 [Smittium mucronatum]|uniref:Uncharacterized protein n=1 Tax=Smittium mucronatum TaxID=133383 RepID=A0A1R0GZG3_9FUNG|nr:hypothetical protein AYI68_g3653 [Smittium mucronatum]
MPSNNKGRGSGEMSREVIHNDDYDVLEQSFSLLSEETIDPSSIDDTLPSIHKKADIENLHQTLANDMEINQKKVAKLNQSLVPGKSYYSDDGASNMIRLQKSKRLSKLKEVDTDGRSADVSHLHNRIIEEDARISEESEDFTAVNDFYFNDGSLHSKLDARTVPFGMALLLYV